MGDPYLGYRTRSKLFDGEDAYFRKNPNVSGMASESGHIILNPYSDPKTNFHAVAKNEALRLFMRDRDIDEEFEIPEPQMRWFQENAPDYTKDPRAMRATIMGRLYSDDRQFEFTPEQYRALEMILRRR